MVCVVNIVVSLLLRNVMWNIFTGHFAGSVFIHEPLHYRYVTDRTEVIMPPAYYKSSRSRFIDVASEQTTVRFVE
jgi:hypothetical protein